MTAEDPEAPSVSARKTVLLAAAVAQPTEASKIPSRRAMGRAIVDDEADDKMLNMQ